MTDDDHDAQRAEIRERCRAERERVAAIPDEEWTAQRDAEVHTVRDWAAARRHSAA